MHKLEKDGSGNPVNLVKEFRRSAAGQQQNKPSELRPPKVCRQTAHYLLQNILFIEGMNSMTYEFVFDRLRSIRQDLTVQEHQDKQESITVYQICVRFHILALYIFGSQNHQFDMNFNFQQLLECLKELLKFYQNTYQDEDQMEAYALYLLINLGNQSAINWALSLPTDLRKHILVKTSLELNWLYLQRNHVRFYRICQQLPLLLKMAVFWNIPYISSQTLTVMTTAYNRTKYPLKQLSKNLCIEENTIRSLCAQHNIATDSETIQFSKKDFKVPQENLSWFDVPVIRNGEETNPFSIF